jgi:hypothetical protein
VSVTPEANSSPTPAAVVARPALGGMFTGIETDATWQSRFVWSILFSIASAVVVTAALLTPNPAGHGTHTQLGLPPCGFLVFTGYPCPGCGLTTSFSYMVRANLFGAWTANPFGIVLFLCTFAMIPLAATGFVRGWSVVATLDRIHAEKIAIGLSALCMVVWSIRVAIEYATGA